MASTALDRDAGEQIFESGSKWTLTHQVTGDLGEMALVYDRAR